MEKGGLFHVSNVVDVSNAWVGKVELKFIKEHVGITTPNPWVQFDVHKSTILNSPSEFILDEGQWIKHYFPDDWDSCFIPACLFEPVHQV